MVITSLWIHGPDDKAVDYTYQCEWNYNTQWLNLLQIFEVMDKASIKHKMHTLKSTRTIVEPYTYIGICSNAPKKKNQYLNPSFLNIYSWYILQKQNKKKRMYIFANEQETNSFFPFPQAIGIIFLNKFAAMARNPASNPYTHSKPRYIYKTSISSLYTGHRLLSVCLVVKLIY